jgi:hypothetical protein
MAGPTGRFGGRHLRSVRECSRTLASPWVQPSAIHARPSLEGVRFSDFLPWRFGKCMLHDRQGRYMIGLNILIREEALPVLRHIIGKQIG